MKLAVIGSRDITVIDIGKYISNAEDAEKAGKPCEIILYE